MWDLGSSHSTDKRYDRYDHGPQYADPDVPVYRSHRSSHRPQRSQSTGRYLSHKARPRSGTAADYYNGGAVQPYHEQESPKQRGRSSTFKDFFKGFTDSDHGSREREHERGTHHRSNSNSSIDLDFATTLLGGAVGGLAGRHYGHTASGAAAGALAAKFLEHELHKHKEEEEKHKHLLVATTTAVLTTITTPLVNIVLLRSRRRTAMLMDMTRVITSGPRAVIDTEALQMRLDEVIFPARDTRQV
ncbi:hypothetical protein KEM56_005714 [Ascosphaera pollenicola]|nr:hypothetical protein KEM56_005714 [Ascosphaera pollenicola]